MSQTADARRPVAVIAFGGNALLRPQDHGTQEEQFTLAWKATRWLVEIVHRGYELVIVHGNGPQVGNIMIQVEEAVTKIPPQRLEVCVAQTEGSMGFMLQNQLRNRLNEEQISKAVVTVLTEVEVARDDPAFENPTKPVGPYFTSYRANLLMQEQGWQMVEDAGRGWRKVVPSPQPRRILDVEVIRRLVEAGAVVIAAGGGGIPVYQDVGGYFRGVEAVIDKDYTTSLLAQELDADLVIILTQVAQVAENFGRPEPALARPDRRRQSEGDAGAAPVRARLNGPQDQGRRRVRREDRQGGAHHRRRAPEGCARADVGDVHRRRRPGQGGMSMFRSPWQRHKDLVSIHDLSADEVESLFQLAANVKARPDRYRTALSGHTLAMIFEKSSTRTRVSFEVGMYQLGGLATFLSSRDIQIGRGETIEDTAKVLSRYVNGIMARTFAHATVTDLARLATIPVINGLTDLLHPCQALTDYFTAREKFGNTKG